MAGVGGGMAPPIFFEEKIMYLFSIKDLINKGLTVKGPNDTKGLLM